LKWVNRNAENDELIALLASGKIVNRYPSVYYLSRKDTFSTLLGIQQTLSGDQDLFEPEAFSFP